MGEFMDLGFDSNLNFDVGDYNLQTPSFDYPAEPAPTYDFGTDNTLTFDFPQSPFELQGPTWDANRWLDQNFGHEPGYNLGGPGAYGAVSGGPAISQYDPSTGVYFDTAGNPITPQAATAAGGPITPGSQIGQEMDPEAFARQGQMSPYSTEAGYGAPGGVVGMPAGQRGPAGPGGGLRDPYTGQPVGGGAPGAGGSGGWADTINAFLKSPLGGLLGAGAVGGAGLGIGRALAGPTPTAPRPSLAPGSPINAAGQGTLAQMFADQAQREAGYQAEQAPGYQNIRNQAMTLIPGQLQPVTVDQYQDPVRAAMQQELMATLQGGASPLVEEQIRKDWDTLQNTMYRQLGNNPDWMLSSPGQEAINAFNRNAAIARDQSKNQKVAAYAPLEQQRAAFGYQAPVERARALGGEQRAYVDTLSRTSALGRMDPYALQQGLGGNPDQYRRMMTQLGFQGGLTGYQAKQQDRRDIMQGVGGIAGTVAGQVGNYGNSDRLARAIREMNGGSTPASGGVFGQRPWGG